MDSTKTPTARKRRNSTVLPDSEGITRQRREIKEELLHRGSLTTSEIRNELQAKSSAARIHELIHAGMPIRMHRETYINECGIKTWQARYVLLSGGDA